MKAGTRYVITSGCYGDYGIRDSFVALKDFSFDLALEAWVAEHHNKYNETAFSYEEGHDDQAFLASLRARGLVADEELSTVHMADYGTPEESPAQDAADEPAEGTVSR